MVSIIILTYNSAKYIQDLLLSLNSAAEDAEMIVVDNNSGDDTVKIVKKIKAKNSKIKLVETGANLGFAKGINRGAAHSKGKYLLFINPDAKFGRGNFDDMVSILENTETIGIVGGRLLEHNGNPEKSAGKFFGILACLLIAAGLDNVFPIRFSPKKTQRVDFVSGGFMMTRRDLFAKLRGFDENFFMYVEDMEYCFRARISGYETYFTPDVEIIHAGQGSSSRSFAIKNIIYGIVYFHEKHGTPFSAFVVKYIFTLKAIALVILGKILNNRYLVSAYSDVLRVI